MPGPYRIAIGALLFEGNTLSPTRNGLQDFRNKYFVTGDALVETLRGGGVELSGALRVLEAAPDAAIVPLFGTHGGAGGRVTAEAWATLREHLLQPLREAGPVDGVYLALHGAMVCEDSDDAEGDLLADVRGIVGDVPIAVSMDLHAHVTQAMAERANILLAYQTYPHDDAPETGERATTLLLRTLRGEVRPVVRLRKAPMLVPGPNMGTNGDGPMVAFAAWAREQEAAGRALAISYLPTQPWLDLPDVGCTALVVTDNDPAGGEALAAELAGRFWQRRHDFEVPLVPPAEAVRQGLALPGRPVVLSDTADCVGGGGTGDSAAALEAVLASGTAESACILLVDPETVQQAQAAGEGATIQAKLGNKLDPVYGAPLEAEARVTRLFQGDFTYSGGILAGGQATMGPCALLQVGPVQVVVSTYSSYEYADEQFRAAGIDPWQCKFVVVKNPMNFRNAYKGAAAMMVLDTPGATTWQLAKVPWQRLSRPRYPVDPDLTWSP